MLAAQCDSTTALLCFGPSPYCNTCEGSCICSSDSGFGSWRLVSPEAFVNLAAALHDREQVRGKCEAVLSVRSIQIRQFAFSLTVFQNEFIRR